MMHFARDRFGKKRKSGASAPSDANRLPPVEKDTKNPRLSTLLESTEFDSVLDRPFDKWNDIEIVISRSIPEWNHRQRGCIILHLIRFLELKVLMDEYVGSQLLSPSSLIEAAWRALILETILYKKVTCGIQDFHGRSRRMIHHSQLNQYDQQHSAEERFRRTQSLFQCCYGEAMPESINEISSPDAEFDDASALTDAQYTFYMKQDQANNQDGVTRAPANKSRSNNGISELWLTTKLSQTSSGIADLLATAKLSQTGSGIVDVVPATSSDDLILQRQRQQQQQPPYQGPFACLGLMFGNGAGVNLEDHITEVTPDDEKEMEGVEVIDVP